VNDLSSRHRGSCDCAQDDEMLVILRAVAGSTVARRAVGRFALTDSHAVMLRAVAGSTPVEAVTWGAA
jgi:hypothetical protein